MVISGADRLVDEPLGMAVSWPMAPVTLVFIRRDDAAFAPRPNAAGLAASLAILRRCPPGSDPFCQVWPDEVGARHDTDPYEERRDAPPWLARRNSRMLPAQTARPTMSKRMVKKMANVMPPKKKAPPKRG